MNKKKKEVLNKKINTHHKISTIFYHKKIHMHKSILQSFLLPFLNSKDRNNAYFIRVLVTKYKKKHKILKSKNWLILVTLCEEGDN